MKKTIDNTFEAQKNNDGGSKSKLKYMAKYIQKVEVGFAKYGSIKIQSVFPHMSNSSSKLGQVMVSSRRMILSNI